MARIKTYARLKPSKKAYAGYEIGKNVLTVHIPDNKDVLIQGPLQNIRSNLSYDSLFTEIFQPEATQEQVFDGVANDIIQNFLNGYNGTIFAYGQTGTGKTYTVEGSTICYNTRGLASRALSMIYQQLENRTDEHISVYLSYLEIYQEVAYDLLNPSARSSIPIAPFAKVTVVEGPRGSCILRGLSLHLAANEEIAQMLLLQGQANRKVAETPVNQRSSRSHAVFTVYLQVRKHDSEILVNSKLHLVDLAGSERVSKTGVDGQQLTEAKSINLSLHHLETVIIALQSERTTSATSSAGGEKSRGNNPPIQSRSNTSFMSGPSSESGGRPYRFVPYRNSLLTMVLKDSLGGNCLTAMIATISLEPENLGESISTCRFAQRVARIANHARRNEEVDDKTLIKRLKHKVAHLENQVALLRSKGKSDPITDEEIMNVLTEEDRIACARIMEGFLQGAISDPVNEGICDQCRFRECLHLLKDQYLNIQSESSQLLSAPELNHTSQFMDLEQHLDPVEPLQPNNPHRDSGDHILSGVNNGISSPRQQLDGPPTSNSYHSEASFLSSPVVKTQPAYEYFTMSEGQEEKACAGAGEHAVDAEKGNDIDQLLEACGKGRDKYKSPFERRREKEIKRLGRKLNSMESEQVSKQEQLEKMKQDTAIQELLAAENSLSLKLQVADEQVADQQAYIRQLKHIQSDPELIAKEQLVEKHLLKRQSKFQEKLDQILQRKTELEKEFSSKASQYLPTTPDSSKKSLEEKFGQYKHGKGSLNTRQVFDLLKNEEKNQEKESAKVDREKAVMKTKQLAIKEAATLEKLRDLKQMLRMSQRQGEQEFGADQSQEGLSEGNKVIPSDSAESNHFSSKEDEMSSNFTTCKSSTNHGMEPQYQQTAPWTPSPLSKNKNASFSNNRSRNSNDHSSISDDRAKHMQDYLRQVLDGAFVSNSAYSQLEEADSCDGVQHVETHHSRNLFQNQNYGHQQGYSSEPENGDFQEQNTATSASPTHGSLHPGVAGSFHDPRHSHKFALEGQHYEPCSMRSPHKYNVHNHQRRDFTYNNNVEDAYSPNQSYRQLQQNLNINNHNENSEIFQEKDENSKLRHNPSLRNGSQNSLKSERPLTMSDLDSTDLIPTRESKSDSRNPTVNISQNNIAQKSASDTSTALTSHPVSLQPTCILSESRNRKNKVIDSNKIPLHVVPPSEYINSMTDQEKFDGRKMGLSSRTFESALSHMLDVEGKSNAPALPYEVDPYEKYSRSSKSPPRRQPHRHSQKSPTRSSSKEKGKSKETGGSPEGRQILDVSTAWGPDIKNLSIADRLSGLLDAPSSFLPAENKSFDASRPSGLKKKTQKHKQHRKDRTGGHRMDPFQAKLAQYKQSEKISDEELSDEDSFFGLQPAKTKLTAMTEEEGERTFMSTVAAEKARIAKIRKAREAAEVIQRKWRKFRARQ